MLREKEKTVGETVLYKVHGFLPATLEVSATQYSSIGYRAVLQRMHTDLPFSVFWTTETHCAFRSSLPDGLKPRWAETILGFLKLTLLTLKRKAIKEIVC